MPMNEIWTTAAAMDLGALNWVNHGLGQRLPDGRRGNPRPLEQL